MKSRTSFFNFTALKKNILRFAPVWALYTVFLLLVLFAISNQKPVYMARDILQVTRLAAWGNLLYAGIVAMCLFGDLYKTRLCCALHAFPMRREGWLLTNIVAGLLFSLIPNALVCAITSVQLGDYSFYIWNLFWVAALQYLFFFGTAVLSALCAGNRLGVVAIYSMIQFIVVLVYFLAEAIYEPLIYGIELKSGKFFEFFPLSRMTGEYVKTLFRNNVLAFKGYETGDWVHLAICAAVGICCFVFAWLVYRRRHLERAGDFVALRPLRPVFLVIYTIAVGALFYTFSDLFGAPTYVLYAAGIIIGYFTGRMLLDRTVRVFYKKSILGFVLLAVTLVVSMVLTWADPLGIGRYVPALDRVKSAAIYGADKTYVYSEAYQYNRFEITDKDEIVKLQSFHKKIANLRPSNAGQYDVRIRYTLTDGTTVNRYYQLDFNSPLAEEAKVWFSDARYIFQVDDPEVLYSLFNVFNVENFESERYEGFVQSKDQEQLKGLLDAILADCAAGNMAQTWWLHKDNAEKTERYVVGFELRNQTLEESYEQYRFRSLSIYSDCTNTLAYLREFCNQRKDNLGN